MISALMLSKYNGLVYLNLMMLVIASSVCCLGKCQCSVNELGVLVERPFTNFKKASEKLIEHFIHQTRKGKISPVCCNRSIYFHFCNEM